VTTQNIIAILGLLVGMVAIYVQVRRVHTLVNQRMTDVLTRVKQLETALEGSDTDIPPDPSEYTSS